MSKPVPPKHPVHMETRDTSGEKLVSPSATRNCQVIGAQLNEVLPPRAHVLEIASGTGQHGAHMCALRPDINWQMSDYDETSRRSQQAYVQDFLSQMPPPLSLDMTQEDWAEGMSLVDAVYCANMIHIAPWEAALGLAKGLKHILKKDGVFCLYGPFLLDGDSAVSNLQFNQSLKSRNPAWGVRNLQAVKHIFADVGLDHCTVIEMPRDNFLLVFRFNH